MKSQDIARQYRELHALQSKAPPLERWKYGKELSFLKKLYIVTKEDESIRSK